MTRYPRSPAAELFLLTTGSEWTRGMVASTAKRWAGELAARLDACETGVVVVEDPAVLALVLLAGFAARRSLAFLPPAKDRAVLAEQMRDLPGSKLVSDQPTLAPDMLFAATDRDAARVSPSLDPLDFVVPARARSRGPFLYLRTSGTTGGPGWVRVHHRDAVLAARAMCRMPHYRSGKHRLVFINPPLFHSYGMSTFLEYLHAGSAFALPSLGKSFFDFLKIGERVTTVEAVPDLYAGLARLSRKVAPAVVHAGIGGDFPRKDDIVRLFQDRRETITVSIRYGLTETPSAVAHNVFALRADADWTSSGRPTPLYRIRIVSDAGTPRQSMEEGPIEIHGRHLAEDLAGSNVASARGIRTLRTEDLGYLDHDGCLHVTGRTTHFIKNRGFRISARVVEEAFLAEDAVEECRVRHDGTELILEVTLRHPIEPARLLAAVSPRLPAYAVPDRVEVVAAIKKTLTGKIVRA